MKDNCVKCGCEVETQHQRKSVVREDGLWCLDCHQNLMTAWHNGACDRDSGKAKADHGLGSGTPEGKAYEGGWESRDKELESGKATAIKQWNDALASAFIALGHAEGGRFIIPQARQKVDSLLERLLAVEEKANE